MTWLYHFQHGCPAGALHGGEKWERKWYDWEDIKISPPYSEENSLVTLNTSSPPEFKENVPNLARLTPLPLNNLSRILFPETKHVLYQILYTSCKFYIPIPCQTIKISSKLANLDNAAATASANWWVEISTTIGRS